MVIGALKKILKKEKKEEKKEELDIIGTCAVCNQPIYKEDAYKKLEFRGNVYYVHQKCFRKAKKLARKLASKGIIPKLPLQ